MNFEVLKKACNECLFSSKKIVSDERKKELLEQIEKEKSFFICHKSSMNGGRTCCNRFYNQVMKKDERSKNALEQMENLGLIKMV